MDSEGFGPVLRGEAPPASSLGAGTEQGEAPPASWLGAGTEQGEAPPASWLGAGTKPGEATAQPSLGAGTEQGEATASQARQDAPEAFGPVVRGRARPQPPVRSTFRVVANLAVLALLAAVTLTATLGVYLSSRMRREQVRGLSGLPFDELNILVVGSDSREGFTAGELQALGTTPVDGRRTDTILLLSVAGGRAAVLSLPRDLYVEQCDGGHGRINAAYAEGGPSCLTQTVGDLTGIGIDNYVEVNLFGFSRIVDAVGGVPIALDQPLVDRAAGLDLPAGCVTLDRRTAVGFVRARNIGGNGDLGRIERQQRFLKALAAEVISPHTIVNVPRLFRVAGAAGSSVTADQGLGPIDLVRVARAARGLKKGGLATYTVPGAFVRRGGASVILPGADAEALFARFRGGEVLHPPTPTPGAPTAAPAAPGGETAAPPAPPAPAC